MTVTIRSTTKIVTLPTGSGTINCRVWEGQTITGVKVHCFIARVAAKDDQDLSQFEAELLEQHVPCAEIRGIPSRLIL